MRKVTPFAGVWIEILPRKDHTFAQMSSLPSRECGLKWHPRCHDIVHNLSLPSRECGLKYISLGILESPAGHSLRGSVD